MNTIPGSTRYEKCARCWHFIERNDDDYPYPFPVAAYLHLDNGEKDHDHDAEPSGDTRTLDQWRHDHPGLFTEYADGNIGPNSAHFRPELQAGYEAAREFSNALGYDGDSYAAYLAEHDRELAAKGYAPVPWPLSLQGNDGE